ncbi:hypothetical protein [Pseudomonas sp. PB3P13]
MTLGRSASILLAVAAVLAAFLSALLLTDFGQTVDWLPADAPRDLPTAVAPRAMPMLSTQALAVSWKQSIFSQNRQPDIVTTQGEAAALQGVVLTGVIINRQAQWALLRLANNRRLKLAVGSALDNGWTLSGLIPSQATFTKQGQTRQLSLAVLRLPPPSAAPVITLPNVPRP